MSTAEFDDALQAYHHGNLPAAKQHALAIIQQQPDHVPAHQLLGAIALHTHAINEAIGYFERAATLAPNDFETTYNLGVVFHQVRNLSQARWYYEQALLLAPTYVPALENLALVNSVANQFDEARALLLKALEIDPSRASLYWNLANIARQQDQFSDVLAYGQRAIALAPQQQTWRMALANDLFSAGDLVNVRAVCQQVLMLTPDHPEAKTLLGCCAMAEGHYPEAETAFAAALDIAPDDIYAHFNRGLLNLKLGNYARGWEEFEWRLRHPDFLQGVDALPETIPIWRGESLDGKHLLVRTEQGFGDTIMFVRYLANLKMQGAKITLQCQFGLKPLLQHVTGIDELIDETEPITDSIDYAAWLLSIPQRLNLDPRTEPPTSAYLSADPLRVTRWGAWLGDTPHKTIGVVCTGNTRHRGNLHRSIPEHMLYPLTALHNTQFVVLQKDEHSASLQALRTQLGAARMPADWDQDSRFVDTAAILTHIDALITVDTATAHLAGALGVPTLLLLSKQCDWRWGAEGDRTPWYPSLTLVRQTGPDWSSAILQVYELLNNPLPKI